MDTSIPALSSIATAIKTHKAAVAADDALYDDDGDAITDDDATINAADQHEIDALRALATMPCETSADVQLKLRYLYEGTAYGGSIYDALCDEYRYQDDADKGTCNGAILDRFYRSLILPQIADTATPVSRTHAHAHEDRQ